MPVPVVEAEDGGEPLIYNRPQKKKKKPWYKLPVFYLLAIMPVVTLWLGLWQMRRLKWKVALIDELDDKLRRDPLRFPRNIKYVFTTNMFSLSVLNEFEYRQFELHGCYDLSRALFVGPRIREDKRGYQLIVPFRRSSGGPDVLVNIGFVADEHIVGTGMNKRLKQPLPYDGRPVTIVTLLPRVYPPSRFALANEPHNNLWMQLNPAQMAHWLNEQAGLADASIAPEAPKESRTFSFFRQFTRTRAPDAQTPQEAFQQSQPVPVVPVHTGGPPTPHRTA
ncbi:surf-like protein [Malassezia nana]|uniref:SURF1-like protein n=1 Tax=Malassezia nana TaxID=180528 RepID=A0AAF0J7Q4_9BASI|nr:surf-like protein [Malassezia nana]